jgi:hypothetical protein
MSFHQIDRAAYRHILTLDVDVSSSEGSGLIEDSVCEDYSIRMVSRVVCYQDMCFRKKKSPGKDVPRVMSSYQVAGDMSGLGWRYQFRLTYTPQALWLAAGSPALRTVQMMVVELPWSQDTCNSTNIARIEVPIGTSSNWRDRLSM